VGAYQNDDLGQGIGEFHHCGGCCEVEDGGRLVGDLRLRKKRKVGNGRGKRIFYSDGDPTRMRK